MPNIEAVRGKKELSVEQIFNETLSGDDCERAHELHEYIMDWVLTSGNLSQHSRIMFMYAHAHGQIGSALTILMDAFKSPHSDILPAEPSLWIEWANYWQRGFRPR